MKKFDQHIKDKLTQPQVPPFDAWKNIEQKLDNKKKKRIIPIWIASSAASVAAIVGIYYWMNQSNDSVTNPIEIVNHPNNIKKESSPFNNSLGQENKISLERDSKEEIKRTSTVFYRQSKTFSKPNSALDVKFNSALNQLNNQQIIINSDHTNEIVQSENSTKPDQKFEHKKQIEENKEKSLEEILKENDEKISIVKAEQLKAKLSISSYVSPIVLVNQNSILSQEFDLNNIENKITTAYGANISYQINDKLKLKGGVAKINLDQMTKDVVTSEPAIASLTMANQTIERGRKQNIRYHTSSAINSTKTQVTALNSVSEVNIMNQQVEFLEIPLEIEYQFLKEKKFSIAATAGTSYYLLTKNNIVLSNPVLGSRSIGEATNINDSHFSANAGVKIGYDINQNINLNLQPNIRFFMNQFQHSNQNSPALFGINLGLSFKIK